MRGIFRRKSFHAFALARKFSFAKSVYGNANLAASFQGAASLNRGNRDCGKLADSFKKSASLTLRRKPAKGAKLSRAYSAARQMRRPERGLNPQKSRGRLPATRGFKFVRRVSGYFTTECKISGIPPYMPAGIGPCVHVPFCPLPASG